MNQLHLEKLLGLILTIIGVTILVIDVAMIAGYQYGFEEAVHSAHIIAPIIVFGSFMTVLGLILLWLNTPELPCWMAIPLSLIYAVFGVILLGIGIFGVIRAGIDLIYHPEFAIIIACGASVIGFGIILFLLSTTKLLNWKDDRDEIYSVIELDKAHASRVYGFLHKLISRGALSGTIEDDEFVRAHPAIRAIAPAAVLVICPYCGAKTEQGLQNCQKCGADL